MTEPHALCGSEFRKLTDTGRQPTYCDLYAGHLADGLPHEGKWPGGRVQWL